MNKALTVAGSDPSGGAGIQADLKVFSDFEVYGMAVITALTAQNTEGIHGIMEIPPEFIEKQLVAVLSDITADAVKTGMLYSPECIEVVTRVFKEYKVKNLVVDTVIRSSSGTLLIKEAAVERLKKLLFPLATVITPNIDEASELSGLSIEGIRDMKEAARILWDLGIKAVIIKGGHLEEEAIDLLYDGREFLELNGERIEGSFHGTGCAFSAALTASLAKGYPLIDSAMKAKNYVANAIKGFQSIGKGMKILRF